jgi:prevent-host-death family protein
MFDGVVMITVGVRELKQRLSELIRMVRESGSEIQVTYRGEVVALLIPVARSSQQDEAQVWAQIDHLAAEIGARWPEGVSAAEAVADSRR